MFIDRSPQAIQGMEEAVERAMVEIGAIAEGYAKAGCPVDTGRLRNSITFITNKSVGDLRLNSVFQAGDSTPHGHPEPKSVAVGTNVEYAPAQEFGENYKHATGGAHFLRNSISNYFSKYYKIVLKHLKGN